MITTEFGWRMTQQTTFHLSALEPDERRNELEGE